ncbi:SDR family oxidoreductase [Pseudarthrobacter niigatensis]|uniref:All-trans-retinol dehydrogenase (NAD+) n=1 Tax=Pseudarthrobacter niigatensis TaxID=369935 RepID=A0AAJ1SVC0_9MICC|nr:SDR family oxidoreductase [Pseudarthrobacter niigatensis]MDQ0147646.1 all-trans-retinol dehydrogenase (NAD+) [Pseudarthrobacter niigatensis]MDQ0267573.1 all-trans-retinol dehydrogenase (NAD+) [Pseudarthrobacter niigatensis]
MAKGTRLAGATLLVTGGGSGLGRRMALGAARRGSRVVIWDVDAAAGAAVCDEIRAAGGQADAQYVDVTDRDAVKAAAAEAGTVDVVVNNAGVVSGQRLLDATEDAIERTMNVNVLALYWVTRAFLGGMVERRRGTVVTVASAAGLVGVARQTDYSASKFAAVGFNESLRAELRADRADVNTLVVCPFYINTGMFDGVRTRWPLLLPILEEEDVAARVLDAIEAGHRKLVLPPLVNLLPVLRVLPVGVFDRLMDVLGVNRTMDHFTGRAPGRTGGHSG